MANTAPPNRKPQPKFEFDAMGGRLPTGMYEHDKFYSYKEIEILKKSESQEKVIYKKRLAKITPDFRKWVIETYGNALHEAYDQAVRDFNDIYPIHSKHFPWLKEGFHLNRKFEIRDDLSVIIAYFDLQPLYDYYDPKDKRSKDIINARRIDDVFRLMKFPANHEAMRIVRESLPRSGIMVDDWGDVIQCTIRVRIEDALKEYQNKDKVEES